MTHTTTFSVTRLYYDGDCKRGKRADASGTTVYVGALEKNVTANITTTYYFAGSTRVAMRVQTSTQNDVYYLHGDHLGSASLTTDASGAPTSQLRYLPYGAPRPDYPTGSVPTDYRFTGQRSEEASLGSLYDYGARFYSPYLNRWIQPDPIVPQPGNPQDQNRYSYVRNNPLKYVDPTGHFTDDAITTYLKKQYGDDWKRYWKTWQADDAWMNLLHGAQADDTLYRVGLDSSRNPLLDVFQFSGHGHDVLSEVVQVDGENRRAVGLHDIYSNKGLGIGGIHIDDNKDVVSLGTVGSIHARTHKITELEDRMVDAVRWVAFTGIGSGLGDIGGTWGRWLGLGFGFMTGAAFDNDISTYPGTVAGDNVLAVDYGERINTHIRRYEMTFTFRAGENNGYFYQIWHAYDNGRRN